MSLSEYEQALVDLPEDARLRIAEAFTDWASDGRFRQVHENISNESALSRTHFAELLQSFSTELVASKPSRICWPVACRDYQLHGPQVPEDRCPTVLGRARGLDDHAKAIEKGSSGAISSKEAKAALRKYSGQVALDFFEGFLRDALLGRHVVWATFNEKQSEQNPFDHLQAREDVRVALGLGHLTVDDELVLLVWNRDGTEHPPLVCPTVADAGDNAHFRPRASCTAPWGLTKPLEPNPRQLPAQPEVVMRESASRALRLPYRLV